MHKQNISYSITILKSHVIELMIHVNMVKVLV